MTIKKVKKGLALSIVVFSLQVSQVWAQGNPTNQRLFDTIPFIPEHGLKRMKQFAGEQIPPGRIVFLGNSITEMGNWPLVTGDSTVVNRGIGGDITFGLLKRLGEITRLKPSRIFLLIGINDIGKDIPPAVIADNIGKIIQRVRAESPGTKIILQTILPVNPDVDGFPQHYDKQPYILKTNSLLAELAKKEQTPLVDLNKLFRDKDGKLRKDLTNDGLHLDPRKDGYSLWANLLKKTGLL